MAEQTKKVAIKELDQLAGEDLLGQMIDTGIKPKGGDQGRQRAQELLKTFVSELLDPTFVVEKGVTRTINARIADGHDPSWLWDVPFERLRGRFVVATGERRLDLAVRLRYAEVDHVVADSLTEAVRTADAPRIDVAANYTAFQEYLEALR